MKSTGMIVLAVLVIGVILLLGTYNTIPTKEEQVNAAWSQVENQYQRRMDLIPNLIETVKGAANFEKSTLQAVVDARAKATQVTISPELLNNPEAMQQFEAAQGNLTSALSRLLAVSENYPQLKANQNFLSLQSQLEGTENRIAVARRDYIEAVRSYNTTIRTLPTLIWAKMLGATPKANFTAPTGAETPPAVKF